MANTRSTKKTTDKVTTSKRKSERTIDSIMETKESVVETKNEPRKYDSEDLIPCRSVIPGELIFHSPKSGIDYSWRDMGDELEMLYSDLRSLYVSRSAFIMKPYFIIMDEELLDQWTNVRELYKEVYKYENLEDVLTYPNDKFENALLAMPDGLKSSLKTLVATKIEDGTFDSLQKIKAMDRVLGTDLQCLID